MHNVVGELELAWEVAYALMCQWLGIIVQWWKEQVCPLLKPKFYQRE